MLDELIMVGSYCTIVCVDGRSIDATVCDEIELFRSLKSNVTVVEQESIVKENKRLAVLNE